MSDYEKRLDAQIGEAIRKRREACGMSQRQLGVATGVSFQQVQKYEEGKNRIASSKLVLAADALKCEASELLGEDNADFPGAHRMLRAWSKLSQEQREAVTSMIETFAN